MADDYVRREILDLYVERMNAIEEKNLARHDVIAAEIRTDNARLEGKLDALTARINAIESKFTRNLALFGIFIAVVLVIVPHFLR